jgi:hypothetical protein
LAFFWIVSALQLLLLSRTLPHDEDAMEAELAEYAESRMQETRILTDDEDSIVSIEDRMTSFDAGAARQTIRFMGEAFREIGDEIGTIRPLHASCQLREESGEEEEEAEDDTAMDKKDFERRKRIWRDLQRAKHRDRISDPATETTLLL